MWIKIQCIWVFVVFQGPPYISMLSKGGCWRRRNCERIIRTDGSYRLVKLILDSRIFTLNFTHHRLGPWATGRADWNPKSGLTGARPVVDHYSITRFSTNEWCQRNADLIAESRRTFQQSVVYFPWINEFVVARFIRLISGMKMNAKTWWLAHMH